MRIKAITVRNTPPVRHFAVGDLSDVCVLAGPNGVGKTRLLDRIIDHLRGAAPNPEIEGTLEATAKEEIEAWDGHTSLDMSLEEDMARFRATLQVNQRRRNLRSSLVRIESDRSIQTLKPFQFSWDLPDPNDEEISWDLYSGFMRDRFQDTVNSMFRMIEAQKQNIANRAIELRRKGRTEMRLGFSDPMQPFKDVFSLLLAPKELADLSARQQRLEYRLDGETREFSTLSSGEREVVNIAFDFLLRKPENCIVFFDEPELHLHPELSYRLIQTLQQIGSNNQFFLSTHSPDVISASLDRSVIFLSSPPAEDSETEPANQAIPVSEADETHQALKLLGHSIGIIALGKRIVLVEGTQSSLDKQTYGSIIKNRCPGLVLVASGGKHAIESFSAVYDAVLSKSLWGVEFFMLCDGDSIPASTGDSVEVAQQGGRLRILPRYHLENYFLDEHVWAEACSLMEPPDSWLRSPDGIREQMRQRATDLVSYATALAAASHLRQSVGNLDAMPSGCHAKTLDDLQTLIRVQVTGEKARMDNTLDPSAVESWVEAYFNRLSLSLQEDSEEWKNLIPGKPLFATFASKAGLNPSRAKTLYLNAALESEREPFSEIIDIFNEFAKTN